MDSVEKSAFYIYVISCNKMARLGKGYSMYLCSTICEKNKAWSVKKRPTLRKEPIDPSGFVDVEAVLQLPRFAGYSISQVENVVKLNDKQRFSLRIHEKNVLQIRANQGHTVKEINPDFKKLTEPFDIGELQCRSN